ncbi:MAG TPA: hypothetical protein VKZ60_06955 [Chloroflexota bacterium]|jgi:hypothetical protein|nr:hypothetical protein [Chloroflexota bacterium]
MATFQHISREEAMRLVTAPRRMAQPVYHEYVQYIRQLDESTAGRLVLAEGEHPVRVRARLRAAARAEGKELDIQRRGNTIVFMLRRRPS